MKRNLFVSISIICLTIVCFLCAGCLNVQYPHRKQYLFHVTPSRKLRSTPLNKILKIDHITIAQQFSGVNFVYKKSNILYLTDYYHIFFIPPSEQIEQIVSRYINESNLFKYVAGEGEFGYVDYTLKTKILALDADYTNAQHPKAVIAIRFALFISKPTQTGILLNKVFKAAVPLKHKDSKTLVKAWNVGLKSILVRLTRQLQRVCS